MSDEDFIEPDEPVSQGAIGESDGEDGESAAAPMLGWWVVPGVIAAVAIIVVGAVVFRGGSDGDAPVDAPPASEVEPPGVLEWAAAATALAQATLAAPTLAPEPTSTRVPFPTYSPPSPRAGGGGSGGSGGSGSGGGGGSEPASRFENAFTTRDVLINAAKTALGGSAGSPDDNFGAPTIWRNLFPELTIGRDLSSDVLYQQTQALDTSKSASADNPYIFAFVVRDKAGRCAGGTIAGYPGPTSFTAVGIPPGAKCRPDAAMDIFVGR